MCIKRLELILAKTYFNILGTDFLEPKTRHRREKQPLLGPE